MVIASGTIIQMNSRMTEGATIRRAAARVLCVDMGAFPAKSFKGRRRGLTQQTNQIRCSGVAGKEGPTRLKGRPLTLVNQCPFT